MLKAMFPKESPAAAAWIAVLTATCSRLKIADETPWSGRYGHVYGALQGQRKLHVREIARTLNVPVGHGSLYDFVLAAETYFCLSCGLLAVAHLDADPRVFLSELADSSNDRLVTFLNDLFAGREYRRRGVVAMPHMQDFNWFLPHLETMWEFKEWLKTLALSCDKPSLTAGADALHHLHHELFPKNLLHATGQFYTPDWLAELLLRDLQWEPAESLIDPFCGCGVFLVAAVRRARAVGASAISVLPRLLGFDISPTACSAAVAALIINLANEIRSATSLVQLNIFSADVLSTALAHPGSQQLLTESTILVDGQPVSVRQSEDPFSDHSLAQELNSFELKIENWIDRSDGMSTDAKLMLSSTNVTRSRLLGQLVALSVRPADVVATNPPWVGWEYIPRDYRKYLDPAWRVYDLFTAKGRDAAFLKEDLSTLSLAIAWDRFLRTGGRSGVVIRPATMRSDLASRGTRRLTVFAKKDPLKLLHIREFHKLRTFIGAAADAATWQLLKGGQTTFPIPVTVWERSCYGWQPGHGISASEIEQHVHAHRRLAKPTNPFDSRSRWSVMGEDEIADSEKLIGSNTYKPRLGVFTGGANGVFYLLLEAPRTDTQVSSYINVVERAKREVPTTRMELENDLVYSVLRGRDLQFWSARPQQRLLCTHSAETRMYPIPEETMRRKYPLALGYLSSMRNILAQRGGFSGWEQNIAESAFYSLQRIGSYTFAPYKVCWKYIASEFTVCVVGPDQDGRPIIPNDKVIFVPFADETAAFCLAGILSSTAVRRIISSSVSNRQISASCIRNLFLPEFDPANNALVEIAALSRLGHRMRADSNSVGVKQVLRDLDEAVAYLYESKKRTQLLIEKHHDESAVNLPAAGNI